MNLLSIFRKKPTTEQGLQWAREGKKDFIFTNKHFRDDKEVILELLKHSGIMIFAASERLRDDLDIAYAALRSGHKNSLSYLGQTVRGNEEFMSDAVKADGLNLQYASTELKDNVILAELAMNQNPFARAYASPRVQAIIDAQLALHCDEDDDIWKI